jgi:16S rRNA (uracil1498-N3)-methyltransferase
VLELDRATSHYLVDVHRMVVGTQFLAFDAQAATQAEAVLLTCNSRGATCSVASIEASRLVPEQRLIVLQAFGKGTRVDDVVRDATALDATEIWVVATEHSSVPNRTEMQGRRERWRKIALESAKQCQRGNVPLIEGVVSLPDVLPKLVDDGLVRCSLQPAAEHLLWTTLRSAATRDVALLVGPEGGFSRHELVQAAEFGFRSVRLGPRVLRTEVVTVAALGVIAAWRDQT